MLTLLTNELKLAVCQFPASALLPAWANLTSSSFISVTRTKEELSVVCEESQVPSNVKSERDWRIMRIKGVLDFGLVGILKQVLDPLAEAKISVYAISTYDTDYVMVKNEKYEAALTVLSNKGFKIEAEDYK